MTISAQITRKSIGRQLDEEFARRSLAVSFSASGEYVIEGQALTPGAAADKYLPAGFEGHFGAEIETPCGHWFRWAHDALAHTC